MLSHLRISDNDILDILNDNDDTDNDDDIVTECTYPVQSIADSELDVSYNLSTMTICGRLGGIVSIKDVIQSIPIIPYWSIREGVLRTEGYIDSEPYFRGISRKYIEKRNSDTKPFRNSASLYCRIFDEDTGDAKEPSVKIFRNGGFQITGIRTPTQANVIVALIKRSLKSVPGLFEETDPGFINICMMNSDITLPYTIDREELQNILKADGILSTFETTSYQGVNIKYYWNYEKHYAGIHQSGICECEHVCESSGKKRVMSNPHTTHHKGCVRITIAPFQTGKIIITGAKTLEQIDDATEWILSVIKKHKDTLLRDNAITKKERRKIPFRGGHTLKIPKSTTVCN